MAANKEEGPWLLEVPPSDPVKIETFKQIEHPIWTKNKAKLIERYLYYFIWVTRHGTYIDGFAGPQRIEQPEMWAAKLVIENRPAWLRHFHLFEIDKAKIEMLEKLRHDQLSSCAEKRSIDVYPGDFNENVDRFLKNNPIKPTEATFCLLDQRTFECDWSTVTAVAHHKSGGNKIELFYFLATSWIDRAVGGLKDKSERLKRWYGNHGWESFLGQKSFHRTQIFADRFRQELGYLYVYPFPIFGDEDGHRTMYWMIHATDHPVAPRLMYRAYHCALKTKEDEGQMELITRQAEALAN